MMTITNQDRTPHASVLTVNEMDTLYNSVEPKHMKTNKIVNTIERIKEKTNCH